MSPFPTRGATGNGPVKSEIRIRVGSGPAHLADCRNTFHNPARVVIRCKFESAASSPPMVGGGSCGRRSITDFLPGYLDVTRGGVGE